MIQKQVLIPGSADRWMPADIYCPAEPGRYPCIVYVHGFNGFKDWGNFTTLALPLVQAGFVVLSFNFSHNGTLPGSPQDFADPDAFGNNNYSKQLYDLQAVINYVTAAALDGALPVWQERIALIGHSMGGGMAVLTAASDQRIQQLVTWAGISHCTTPWGKWTREAMQQWKETGVAYYENKRTRQLLPLYYQLHEDYLQHAATLDILKAAASLKIPYLICHGLQDTSVPAEAAMLLKMAQPQAQLCITDGDHVFDRRHPAATDALPPAMLQVLHTTIHFLQTFHP